MTIQSVADLSPMAPVLVMSSASVLLMLVIAFVRSHALAFLFGLAAVMAALGLEVVVEAQELGEEMLEEEQEEEKQEEQLEEQQETQQEEQYEETAVEEFPEESIVEEQKNMMRKISSCMPKRVGSEST